MFKPKLLLSILICLSMHHAPYSPLVASDHLPLVLTFERVIPAPGCEACVAYICRCK